MCIFAAITCVGLVSPSARAERKPPKKAAILGVLASSSPVALTNLKVTGAQDPRAIRTAIQQAATAAKQCAQDAGEPMDSMPFPISFSIMASGQTVGVAASGKSDVQARCVRNALKSLTLAAANGTSTVEATLEFQKLGGVLTSGEAFGSLYGNEISSASLKLNGVVKRRGNDGHTLSTLNADLRSASGACDHGRYHVSFSVSRLGVVRDIKVRNGSAIARSCLRRVLQKTKLRRYGEPSKFVGTIEVSLPVSGGGLMDGGGTSVSSVPWGTIGGGRSGIGSGSGVEGKAMLGTRGRSDVRVGNATSAGPLDKNIIRRVIRRRLNQIRYCYERELAKKPALAGTVVTEFRINPDGAVSKVNIPSGISANVDTCIQRTLMSLRFPEPKGGGVVTVRYPFVFRPAAGAKP